jgi:NAD-dependent dihydropyrimidine dehydrogenase PreA subunit
MMQIHDITNSNANDEKYVLELYEECSTVIHDLIERRVMAYVITLPCIGVKDAGCVSVCPVDCIHPTKDDPEFGKTDMLFIDPGNCIICGACVEECPVTAIFPEEEVPAEWQNFIAGNAAYFSAKTK